ncbi:MAG: glycosyltransferase family 4 protein [Candidatus Latescibacterota bacterium]|nr:glycosyltransferase family 4 protein [Candidatus Latescibacterota bacterium]
MTAPRVCVLSSVHLLYDVRMFQAEARTLAAAGFAVTVLAIEDPSPPPADAEAIRTVGLPHSRNRLVRFVRTFQILRRALAEPADIYAFHDPELLPAAALLRILRRKPVIFDVHEDVPASIRNRDYIIPLLRPLVAAAYRLLERICLPVIDGLSLADHAYARYYRSRPHAVILNYPLLTYGDLYRPLSTGNSDRPLLVYTGSVTRLRGLFEMLEAVDRLRRQIPGVRLRIVGPVGNAQEEAEAQQFIRDRDLSSAVEFTGLVSHQEVHEHIREADVGLALLHPDPNYLRSLPTKMFEYMMMGRPVVVSDFPLWKEIVEDAGGGYAVDPLDADAVETALKELLSDAEARRYMGEAGRQAVMERYNWQGEGAKLVEIYREVLAATGSAMTDL